MGLKNRCGFSLVSENRNYNRRNIATLGALSRGFSNLPWCERALRPGTKYVFKELFWGVLGALCRGRPWYGTSGQPESHFTRSSPRCTPRVVPSTFLFGCGFFAYSWKLPAYNGAFLLTIDNFSFLLTVGAFLLTILASLFTVGVFCL